MADVNALIASLRSVSPGALKQAQGPQTLSYPWMANTEGPLILPTRKTTKPSTPSPVTPSPVTPEPVTPTYIPPTDTSAGSYGITNQPMQQSDWDKLNADYASAYNQAMQSGMSAEDWTKTPTYGNWQTTVLSSVGKTNDPAKLTKDINWLSSQENLNDPVYGDWYKTLLQAEQEKLNQLYPSDFNYFE